MSGAVPPLSHKSQHAQGQFYLHFCIMNCYGLSPFSFVSLDLEDAHGPPSLFHFHQFTVPTGYWIANSRKQFSSILATHFLYFYSFISLTFIYCYSLIYSFISQIIHFLQIFWPKLYMHFCHIPYLQHVPTYCIHLDFLIEFLLCFYNLVYQRIIKSPQLPFYHKNNICSYSLLHISS